MKENSTEITYIGIDAHKKDHKVCILYPGDEKGKEVTINNHRSEIKRLMKKIKKQAPGEVRVCYEAGPCGFILQRQIEEEGVSCVMIAPSLIPVKPGERIKTDRRDARKLADYFKAGLLTEITPPTRREESVRDLCRCREAAKKSQTRSRHQLSKFLLRRGYVYREGRAWTQRHHRWLNGLKFEDEIERQVFEEYLAEVEHSTDRVKSLEAKVEQVSKEVPYAEPVGWLRCFRGIDTITAMTILSELYGIGRFPSARHLMAYLGLVASEDSSGEKQRRGRITKTGNQRVRRVLVESAWHQRNRLTTSPVLKKRREGQPKWVIDVAEKAKKRLHHRYWWLVNQGKTTNVAVVAVAREMVGFIWSVLYTQVDVISDAVDRPVDRGGVVDNKKPLPTAP